MSKHAFFGPLASAAVLAAAAAAFAHGTSGIIEIEPIDARVDAQLGATTGKVHRAYAALARVIRKPSRKRYGLADDMTKLIATVKACSKGLLATDTVLRAALPAPEAQADQYLTDEPGDVQIAARHLERAADRAKVQAALDAADAAHAAGVARRGANDEIGMLADFRTAGAKLARAGALVQSLLAKQVRRSPPGQPLPKGPKGTIDTYAGTGTPGFAGDGGPALDAAFYFPMDVTTDPSTGLVYVCDFNNHRIRRIDADGKVRTVAGTGDLGDTEGPALQAKLHHPASITFHPTSGDLYIAGWHVHRIIRLLAATDTIEHYAGGVRGDAGDEGPVTAAEFNYPSCVTFDSAGGWYVSDQDNNRVRYVDPAGTIHAFAGTGTAGFAGDGGPALAAELQNPDGDVDSPAGRCALDPTEKFLYIADSSNHRVRKVDLTTHVITTFAGNGVAASDGDGGDAAASSIETPVDVDCDAAGNVYVCDRDASVVRKVDAASNVISTFAGVRDNAGYSGDGKSATLGRLDHPSGIFVDRVRGRLYVADTGNSVIRVVWE
jgi:DNA-binding beta-propeller fold protein YncE